MRVSLLAYGIGVLSGSLFNASSIHFGKPILLLALSGIVLSFWKYRKNAVPIILPGLLFFSLGAAWHGVWASQQLDARIPVELERVDQRIVGKVRSIPQRFEAFQRFEFYIEQSSVGFEKRVVRLDYYGKEIIAAGQHWEFDVRLKQPRGFVNIAGFDFEAWSLQRQLSATGYVRSGHELLLGSSLSIRGLVYQRLMELLGESKHAGIVIALTLGHKGQIAPGLWDLFEQTGTNHLWVISGLHIGLLATLFYLIAKGMFRLALYRVCSQEQGLCAIVVITSTSFYAYLAGFSLSVQRALIMIAVLIISGLWNRKISWDLKWCIAFVLVLSLNPLAGMSPGFWFSFFSVAALLLFVETSNVASKKGFSNLLSSQWRVWVALFLPLAYWNGQLSYISPLVNLLAIPVTGFILVPVSLLLIPLSFLSEPISLIFLALLETALDWLFMGMESVSSAVSNGGLLNIGVSNPVLLATLILGILLIMLPLPWRLKLFSIPLLLPLVKPAQDQIKPDEWRLDVFDVGQGLSVLVRTENYSLLFDTAAGANRHSSIANSEIIPSLKALQVNSLDGLIISHGDNDHSGGVDSLSASIPINLIYASSSVVFNSMEIKPCALGIAWHWDGVHFEFLNGLETFPDSNNNSCVLKVSGKHFSALLPGDIERDAEYSLSAHFRNALSSSILIAPHHGSNSSSSFAFIKQVQPGHVVYSAAYKSQFGHPAPEVKNRYSIYGAEHFETGQLGMISFIMDESRGELKIDSYRPRNPRYWRHQAIAESADKSNYGRINRIW